MLCIVIFSPAWYVAACCVISNSRKEAFHQIHPGDTRQAILASFGTPSHVEFSGGKVGHYGQALCTAPCAERLWFENSLTPDLEVWSIDLDGSGRVLDKLYTTSS